MGRSTLDPIGVLGLYTETPLHCGAESGTGYVDLPIQRERHTGFPVIPGSTLKGVLRDEVRAALRRQSKNDSEVSRRLTSLFGSDDPERPSPGQVSFGDGILVAFPVRSSGVPFHWVTCPFVLERLGRVTGRSLEIDPPPAGSCWAIEGGEVLLEELRLDRQRHEAFFGEEGGLEAILALVPTSERGFGYSRRILAQRLLVLSDDDFRELTETGTEVLTRIKLTALGTTTNIPEGEHPEIEGSDRQGNLFVQEVVPPESLFVSPLRTAPAENGFGDILAGLGAVRIGGDETIGRGITHLTFHPVKERR